MVLLQPLVWKNISLLIFKDFLFATISITSPWSSKTCSIWAWPLLQPLVLKNISFIFKESLFGQNFNIHYFVCRNVNIIFAIIDSRALELVPDRHGIYIVLLVPLVLKDISVESIMATLLKFLNGPMV